MVKNANNYSFLFSLMKEIRRQELRAIANAALSESGLEKRLLGLG